MKRLVNLLLAVVLMLAMSPAAFADAIYVPDDEFSENNVWTPERQSYSARTEVTVYENPASSRVVGTLSPEEDVYVHHTYLDGLFRRWGYIETTDFSGWMPMAYMKSTSLAAEEELPPLPWFEIRPGFTPIRVIIGSGVVLCVVITAVVLLKKKMEDKKK